MKDIKYGTNINALYDWLCHYDPALANDLPRTSAFMMMYESLSHVANLHQDNLPTIKDKDGTTYTDHEAAIEQLKNK